MRIIIFGLRKLFSKRERIFNCVSSQQQAAYYQIIMFQTHEKQHYSAVENTSNYRKTPVFRKYIKCELVHSKPRLITLHPHRTSDSTTKELTKIIDSLINYQNNFYLCFTYI